MTDAVLTKLVCYLPVMHLPRRPSRFPVRTALQGSAQSLPTHSAAALQHISREPALFSAFSLDRPPHYTGRGHDLTVLSAHDYNQSRMCPVQPIEGCSMNVMLMLHGRNLCSLLAVNCHIRSIAVL